MYSFSEDEAKDAIKLLEDSSNVIEVIEGILQK